MKKQDKKKIKEAIKLIEYKNTGLDKINSAFIEVRNLRKRKDHYIADIVIRIYEEGYSERYNNCIYTKESIERVLKALQ